MWGSRYQDGSVHFNWKIVMAPMRIIDYVIVHELCRLRHHARSRAFWKMLSLYLPDYPERNSRPHEIGQVEHPLFCTSFARRSLPRK